MGIKDSTKNNVRNSDELPDETKFPIILPKSHVVTGLIVKYHHKGEGHEMGVNFTINHLREKYLVFHCMLTISEEMRQELCRV